jgi:hypothetical protein
MKRTRCKQHPMLEPLQMRRGGGKLGRRDLLPGAATPWPYLLRGCRAALLVALRGRGSLPAQDGIGNRRGWAALHRQPHETYQQRRRGLSGNALVHRYAELHHRALKRCALASWPSAFGVAVPGWGLERGRRPDPLPFACSRAVEPATPHRHSPHHGCHLQCAALELRAGGRRTRCPPATRSLNTSSSRVRNGQGTGQMLGWGAAGGSALTASALCAAS